MSISGRVILVFLVLSGVFVASILILRNHSFSRQMALRRCASMEGASLQIDCAYRTIRRSVDSGGVIEGMAAFEDAYRIVSSIQSTGCHRHAHRIGDMVYFDEYRRRRDPSTAEFPASISACSFGFVHGFIEHVIQDNPDPTFVVKVCTGISKTLQSRFIDIYHACIHAGGHGELLAHGGIDQRKPNQSVESYLRPALTACDLLPTKGREKEWCRDGVFNVFTDMASDRQNGFSISTSSPFTLCDGIDQRDLSRCREEISRKLAGITHNDLKKMTEFIDEAVPESDRKRTLINGLGGVVLADPNINSSVDRARVCKTLPNEFKGYCYAAIVHGIFETSLSGEEAARAASFCSGLSNAPLGRRVCWTSFGTTLRRFYGVEDAHRKCTLAPVEFREICVAGVASTTIQYSQETL